MQHLTTSRPAYQGLLGKRIQCAPAVHDVGDQFFVDYRSLAHDRIFWPGHNASPDHMRIFDLVFSEDLPSAVESVVRVATVEMSLFNIQKAASSGIYLENTFGAYPCRHGRLFQLSTNGSTLGLRITTKNDKKFSIMF